MERPRAHQLISERISALDQTGDLHRLSTRRGNTPKFGILWIWRSRRTTAWSTTAPEEEFIHSLIQIEDRDQIRSFAASLCASGCSVCFSLSDRFGHTSPNRNSSLRIPTASTSAPPRTTARLDPEVPPRSDPASEVMGKMIRYQVNRDHWKVVETAKHLKDYLYLYLVAVLIENILCVFVAIVCRRYN